MLLPTIAGAGDTRYGVVAAPGLANDFCGAQSRVDLIAELGVGWVRVAKPWEEMEPAPGALDPPEAWQETDRLVDRLAASGVQIYWDFGYTPAWARTAGCNAGRACPPQNQQDLYNFIYKVVRRYGFERNQIKYWGHWNEVNLGDFYQNGDVARFVTHELPTTINAIKAADPAAQIVVGELSSSPGNANVVASHLNSILQVAGADAAVISQHIYDGDNTAGGRLSLLDGIRQKVVDAGHGNLPWWITETGLDESSESARSTFLNQFYNGMVSRWWWHKTFWYRLEAVPGQSWHLINGGPTCPFTTNSTFDSYKHHINAPPPDPCVKDGQCVGDETPENCPDDCPPPPPPVCNNDGDCDNGEGENNQNCPNDCFCDFNSHCDPALGENEQNCSDCSPTASCNYNCICDSNENDISCPQDCGVSTGHCCPNQACEPGERFCIEAGCWTDCPADCPEYPTEPPCLSTGCPGSSCGWLTDNCGASVYCGDCCDDPTAHDHFGGCGSSDSCGHVFGSSDGCGCPDAPIIWDTCSHEVCDQGEYWVEEYCESCNRVCTLQWVWIEETCESCNWTCDTGWNWVEDTCETCDWSCDTCFHCRWKCDMDTCWEECSDYSCNCQQNCYTYGCNGHWESYEYNCRNECYTYSCNGHWEYYEDECHDECYNYVCGGHWEYYQYNCRIETYDCNPHQCGF